MGGRFDHIGPRQHPDLTPPPDDTRALRAVVLTLLAVDGVISAVLASFFLSLRLGPVPFPISALISGLLNVALVRVALQWTSSPRLAALPLWTWLATVAVFTFPASTAAFGVRSTQLKASRLRRMVNSPSAAMAV